MDDIFQFGYVERFGDHDEKGDVISQRGKAVYLARQLFREKKVGVDASGEDIMVRDKDASIKAYKANFESGSHPYRTGGINAPDEKGTCKVQTEVFKDLLKEYPDADKFSRTVVIPAKDAEAFRKMLRTNAIT